jgi:hypothetical protein
VRAALGLLANAVDAARTLPDRAVELPVLAVSTALQFSLRAQQRYAELAMRGDEVIDRFHGPPDEPPAWATFDDAPAEPNGTGASAAPTDPVPTEAAAEVTAEAGADPVPTEAAAEVTAEAGAEVPTDPVPTEAAAEVTAEAGAEVPTDPVPTEAAAEVPPEMSGDPVPTEAAAEPPDDIPIGPADDPAAPIKSPAKQPRARKAPVKKASAATDKAPKTVRAPRQAEPSAFDRTDNE